MRWRFCFSIPTRSPKSFLTSTSLRGKTTLSTAPEVLGDYDIKNILYRFFFYHLISRTTASTALPVILRFFFFYYLFVLSFVLCVPYSVRSPVNFSSSRFLAHRQASQRALDSLGFKGFFPLRISSSSFTGTPEIVENIIRQENLSTSVHTLSSCSISLGPTSIAGLTRNQTYTRAHWFPSLVDKRPRNEKERLCPGELNLNYNNITCTDTLPRPLILNTIGLLSC